MSIDADAAAHCLRTAGLDEAAVVDWISAAPDGQGFEDEPRGFPAFWQLSDEPAASPARQAQAQQRRSSRRAVHPQTARAQREQFLALHAEALYDKLTRNRSQFIRLEDLVFAAAAAVPGLTPTSAQVAAEAELLQRDKDGLEIDQGIFLAHVLASETAGRHLCHAMLLPRAETAELLKKLETDGRIDLGPAQVERRGKATILTAKNPRFLNAEDNSTLDVMEIAVDLAILDPSTDIAVLRGGTVDHPKYARPPRCSAPAST